MIKVFLYVTLTINLLCGGSFLVKAQNEEINVIVKQNLEESFSHFIKSTAEDLRFYFKNEFSKKTTELSSQLKTADLINIAQSTAVSWWENAWNYVQTEVSKFGK